ncbi:helix-turn-helix domain-containing protein [Humibacter ginsenosidimutans]|uniref:Helix-turn-helix domain-containing protein n=2 Tax=Humibacter ginsenosidimutans TaxID=2599293 RepID=A0A5B8M878_9MICO|nr:helix-turn-helix domain-containing protein [Humibacter ginsenosidimutans]
MARRAQVSPDAVGLPAGPRRRTPGLRREEVAVLAGVGVSWYQWLEQGRDITVSGQVLDAVARVLGLGEAERRHLYVLAGLNPPLPAAWQGTSVAADLIGVIERWMPHPAHLLDRYWNLIGANRAAQLVLGYDPDDHGNCLRAFFVDPMYRTEYVDWSEHARRLTAQYRALMSEHPGDEGYAEVIERLSAESADFAELWGRHEVRDLEGFHKVLDHPAAGRLDFESTQLSAPGRPDLLLVLHNPIEGTDTAAKVQRMLDDDRRSHLTVVAG